MPYQVLLSLKVQINFQNPQKAPERSPSSPAPSPASERSWQGNEPHAMSAFHKHPSFTIDVIRLKRIPLPDKVITAILQHHEAMNGTGYPSGLAGHRITTEGRILAISNSFDKLTSLKTGKKRLTPREALQSMLEENQGDPLKMILDVEILKKLIEFI